MAIGTMTITVRVRLRYKVLGGHTHVRVFCSLGTSDTLGKCGDLVFRNEEWALVEPMMKQSGVECLPEDA